VPFWYSKRKGEEGKILVPTLDQLPVNPLTTPPTGYTMDEVEPDMDVMDTWATSSITPQMNARAIAKGFALDEDRAAKLFPADMRPQSHEIIRTWAFYTIAKALLHSDTVPFHNAAISGWILAADHTKMSKSKGNGVPPDVLLKDHGADVVRYWAGNYRLGNDTAFSVDVLKQGRRLATKLWNASKLVAPQIGDQDSTLTALPATAPLMDRWIMARLADTLRIATKNFSEYCFAGALEAAEAFFWKDYCDNYLEACKGRLYGEVGTTAEQDSARHTLAMVHRAILSLFAPFMPYLTEELFSKLYPEAFAAQGSIHARSSWPNAEAIGTDEAAQMQGAIILELITGVRRLKAANKASVKAAIPVLDVAAPETVDPSQLASGLADFQHMTSTRSLTWVPLSAADDTWQPSDNETLKVRGTVEMTAAPAKAAS
jgi:valyl-tRNA synthetase